MNSLYGRFEEIVSQHGDRMALLFPDANISFGDLSQMADACAAWLVQTCGPHVALEGRSVVLQLPKAPLTYAMWLACIRQGAIYTFADPKNPPERMDSIVAQLLPVLTISTQDIANPHGKSIRIDNLENISGLGAVDGQTPKAVHRCGNDPVYAMFTSGSTGEPKGAVIPGQGVLNLMEWARRDVMPLAAKDRSPAEPLIFSNINPLHFDNSVFDLFCGLLNGNTLVPVETAFMPNPSHWVRLLAEKRAEVIFGVPTLFQTLSKLRMLTRKSLPDARLFSFGGEGFPVQALQNFFTEFESQAVLLNVYGPTETSCICSSIVLDEKHLALPGIRLPSIGRMHEGFKYAVIGTDGLAVTRGDPGELWIGGDNVGLGYFGREDITRNAFHQNPLHNNWRDIWYRSGDLVTEGEDGYLWFVGRADNQVKVRGYRIELEEIDAAVERFEGVQRANTVVADQNGNDILVAAFNANHEIDHQELTEHCQSILPHYMIPARFVQMAELPKNANGKVDRKAILAAVRT